MKIKFIALCILSAVSLLTACSNPLGDGKSHVDSSYGPGSTTTTAETSYGYESVSGAKHSAITQNSTHKVDATIGASTNQVKLTTSRNRILYLSVQGQIVSVE